MNGGVETILQYPERYDEENFDQRSTGHNYFANEAHFNQFITDVKKFAFPYVKTLAEAKANKSASAAAAAATSQSSSLVQFYSFAFTDSTRVRQYGFCRSSQLGKHVLCMISFLPWYNVFNIILNKIAMIINEKEVRWRLIWLSRSIRSDMVCSFLVLLLCVADDVFVSFPGGAVRVSTTRAW